MLRLRDLIANPDLTRMLLGSWDHERSGSFRFVRASANVVYSFELQNETCYLRYCPCHEKPADHVAAELRFIRYLRTRGYNAPQVIPSRSHEDLVCRDTPWGCYLAAAFRGMPGRPIGDHGPLSAEVLCAIGRSLGRLHRLSSEYPTPEVPRWSYREVLGWIEQTLGSIHGQKVAIAEAALLRTFLSGLTVDETVYGLVHYDFETDNVFLDPATGSLGVIDFDDAMYHWYGMDLEQTLDSLAQQPSGLDASSSREAFFAGYRAEFPLDQRFHQLRPVFRRFADLYGYTRVLRSVQETLENEPEWMQRVRQRLTALLAQRSVRFGSPIAELQSST